MSLNISSIIQTEDDEIHFDNIEAMRTFHETAQVVHSMETEVETVTDNPVREESNVTEEDRKKAAEKVGLRNITQIVKMNRTYFPLIVASVPPINLPNPETNAERMTQ